MTLKRFGHIALCLIAGLAGISCDGDRNAATPDPIPAEKMVNLAFSVVAPDAVSQSESRAIVIDPDKDNYFEREDSQYEKIHTLRIIILRPGTDFQGNPVKDKDGKPILDNDGNPYKKIIEHNRFFTFNDNGVVRYDDMNITVHGGENKTIYIIANEEGINSNRPEGETAVNLSDLTPDDPYVAGTIEDIEIHAAGGILYDNRTEAATKTYIPMAEVYEDVYIEMPETPELREQKVGPFFITRAAVKFSFNITAEDNEGLYLKSLTFNSLADKEYLLPRNTEYKPEKPTFHQSNNSGKTDGIKNPSDTGNSDIDPDISGRFITEYEIPEDAKHSPFTFNFKDENGFELKKKQTEIAPVIYFCESKFGLPFNGEPVANGTPYSVELVLHTKFGDQTVVATSEELALGNLPILPRNTHVKININLIKNEATVELVPYTGVWLNPDFGIDRE
ncbi:hypothetical protein [uncultured Duncaniella sp.]|uniref:hypothetical protein n=1 Tax=uncultured Duncaniella sp. TaxID=2768039 RepID=UPI0025E9CAA8|nr:hypothetical protein [uncultured Duncaniella sp.]